MRASTRACSSVFKRMTTSCLRTGRRPSLTDADGRFTLEGVPRCPQVSVTFWHPDHAVDEVTVDTTESGTITPSMKGFEIVPVKPNFTHTLEPARPVQGRVTDKASGKPLAGMLVEMIPMRRHGGMPFRGPDRR